MSNGVRWSSGFVTSGASSANVQIPLQSSTQKGDYLVAFLQSDNTSAGKFTNSGWGDPPTGAVDWNLSVDSGRFTILVKRSDGTEGGTTATFASSGSLGCCGVVVCLYGVDETTLIDAIAAAYTSTSWSSGNVTLTASTITTTKDNDLLLYVGATDSTDGATAITTTTPSGFTDRGKGQDTSGWNAMSVASKALTTHGSVGSTSTTFTQGTVNVATGVSAGQIAFAPFSLEQYAFRFGADDANEASHTWLANENVNYSAALGTAFLIRLGINASADPPDLLYKLRYKKNGSGSYADVPIGATTAEIFGTITFGAIGTGANGSTTVAPSYPTGITAGQYLVAVITSGSTSNTTPTDSGSKWTQLATAVTTDGSYGIDTGPRRVTVFGCIADGSESGTYTFNISTGDSCRGTISRFTKSGSGTWTIDAQGAADSGNHTGITMTTSSMNWNTGDAVLVANCQRVDNATQSSQSLTATGVTFGTRTNRAATAVTTGNDHRHSVDTFAAITGTSNVNAAPTWAYTASAAASSATVIVRLREYTAAVTNEIFIEASSNIASSGEATTARLTAPSGKSSGSDFATGRRWDDENGTDSLNFGNNKYSELEYRINTQSPAADTDYYEFELYNFADAFDTYTNIPKFTIQNSVTLTVNGMSVALTEGNAALTQQNTLAMNALNVGVTSQNAALTQQSTLTMNNMAVAVSEESPTLTLSIMLTMDALSIGITESTPALVQQNTLAMNAMNVGITESNIDIVQQNTLAMNGLAVATSMNNLALTQQNVLSVAAMSISVAEENPTLSVFFTLSVDPLNVGITEQNVDLVQQNVLSVNGISVATTVGSVSLVQQNTLAVNNLSVSTTEQNVALVQQNTLTADSQSILTSLGNVALIQQNTLSVNGISIATSEESPTLTFGLSLTVNGLLVSTTESNIALVQQNTLAVSGLAVGTTSQNIALSQNYTLSVDNVSVNEILGAPALIQQNVVTATTLNVGITESVPSLIQQSTLSVNGMTVTPIETNIDLFQGANLTVQNMLISPALQTVILDVSFVLSINNMTVGIVSESVVLTQNNILSVANLNVQVLSQRVIWPGSDILPHLTRRMYWDKQDRSLSFALFARTIAHDGQSRISTGSN